MQFNILGDLQVIDDDGGVVLLGGPKPRAVFALLVLGAPEVVPIDNLVDALWGDQLPADPRASIYVYVSTLRRKLDGRGHRTNKSKRIVARHGGYALTVEVGERDLDRATELLAAAEVAESGRALQLLREAENLWRGPILEEFAGHTWVLAHRRRLAELRWRVMEDRIAAELTLGNHRAIVSDLHRLIAEDPLRERWWEMLMLALYRSGRQADALRTFSEARERLRDELGISPSTELAELESKILRQDPTLLFFQDPAMRQKANLSDLKDAPSETQDSLSNRRTTASPGSLPRYRNSFEGRQADINTLSTHISRSTIVTLCGAGGVGKTRLAVHLARSEASAFGGGLRYIDLACVTIADGVWTAAAEVMAPESAAPLEYAAADLWADSDVLVILDNCEHVLEAARGVATILTDSCPNLLLLATSREPLGLEGEQVYRVEPLTVPSTAATLEDATSSPSVRLLAARAANCDPTFRISHANVASIVNICRHLDGVPLALELVAPRLTTLGAADVASRLDETFGLLRSSTPRVARQRTISAVIGWSYELLSSEERTALTRLSSFPDSFSLSAAEATLYDGSTITRAEGASIIDSLVTKSLLQISETSGGFRYRMLNVVRSFARAHSIDLDVADACRLRFFLQEAQEVASDCSGLRTSFVQREVTNLRSVLELASHDSELATEGFALLRAIWPELQERRGAEAVATAGIIEGLVEWRDASGPDLVLGATAVAHLYVSNGLALKALPFARLGVDNAERLQDSQALIDALLQRLAATADVGDTSDALEDASLAVSLAREYREPRTLARCLRYAARAASMAREPRLAVQYSTEALALAEDQRDTFGEYLSLGVQWEAAILRGDAKSAKDMLDRQLPWLASADTWALANRLNAEAMTMNYLGDEPGGAQLGRAALIEMRAVGALSDLLEALVTVGHALRRTDVGTSVELSVGVTHLARRHSAVVGPVWSQALREILSVGGDTASHLGANPGGRWRAWSLSSLIELALDGA